MLERRNPAHRLDCKAHALSGAERDRVLALAEKAGRFRRRGVSAAEVPVYLVGLHVVVVLPASHYPADEQIRFNGLFQFLMARNGQAGCLDFSPNWRGLDTPLVSGV